MKKILTYVLTIAMMIGLTVTASYADPPQPVPEPATWLLFGAGAAGLAAYKAITGRKK